MWIVSEWSLSVVSDSLRPHGLQPTRLLCPWNSLGKKTGVGSHSLLQGTFPVQGLNLGLIERTSLVAQMVKRLPTMRETQVQSLGQEDPLEKEMATHSSTLAWKIPWTEEHSRLLLSTGLQRIRHDWATSLSLIALQADSLPSEGPGKPCSLFHLLLFTLFFWLRVLFF